MAYVTVKGTVTKFHQSGTGFAIEEKWTGRDGTEYSKTWQVFPAIETHGALPGNTVTVNGTLNASVYTYQDSQTQETAHATSLKINNGKVTVDDTTTAPQVQNDSAPF